MQIWPQGAWFGITWRRLRVPVFAALALALALRGYSLYVQHEVSALFAETMALRPGESNAADVAVLLHHHGLTREMYGDCPTQHCTWTIRLKNSLFTRESGDIAVLRMVGMRPVWPGATVTIANGPVEPAPFFLG